VGIKMVWTVEILNKDGVFDAVGEDVKKSIQDFGITGVKEVRFIEIYRISGALEKKEAELIARELLADRITQEYRINAAGGQNKKLHIVEVAYNPGVMDPVEESAMKGIKDLGVKTAKNIRTARKYVIEGDLSAEKLDFISEKLLYNKTIEHIVKESSSEIRSEKPSYKFKKIEVEILGKNENELSKISEKGQLFLNKEEMLTIQAYFKKLGRNPSDVELEAIAQTWSEHCKHKTLRGKIEYEGKTIDNLLKETIMKVTDELAKEWCVSVFHDNSGIIKFNEDYDVCFKVETHNHPSAIEPYGGAGTGIGGVIGIYWEQGSARNR